MDLSWARYVACGIQGEGSISLLKRKDSRTSRGYYFQPNISVSNTDKEWVEFLKTITGVGYIHKDDSPSRKKKGWKTSYQWTVTAIDDIIYIIREVTFSLMGKKEKLAFLLLDYCYRRKKQERVYHKDLSGRFVKGFQIEYTPRMIEIYEEMRKLNKKGRRRS